MLTTEIKEIWTHLGGPNSLSVDDPSLSTDSCKKKNECLLIQHKLLPLPFTIVQSKYKLYTKYLF